MTETAIRQLSELLQTMRHLRSDEGCAWDREQTPESLCPYIQEEAYELIDAIEGGDKAEICAELGDLLLQVVFQAQIFTERGDFGLGEIAAGINRKLQRRHPRIFSAGSESGDHLSWEEIKQQELKERGKATGFAARLPQNLPTLKLTDKICRHLDRSPESEQFPLEGAEGSLPPSEEMSEKNLGRALYALVHQAQRRGIDSDRALRKHALALLQKQTKMERIAAGPEG